MIKEFLSLYVKKIAYEPEKIYIERQNLSYGYEFIIYASENDVGRIVGKDGSMIASLNTIIAGCKTKSGVIYKVVARNIPAQGI